MPFIRAIGEWQSVDILPANDKETFYAVTIQLKRDTTVTLCAEEHFRFYNNNWQYFRLGQWHNYIDSSTWDIIAYIPIEPLSAFKPT